MHLDSATQFTLSLGTIIAAGIALWRVAKAFGRVEELEKRVINQEGRLARAENSAAHLDVAIAEIKTHLAWIRLAMSNNMKLDPTIYNHPE